MAATFARSSSSDFPSPSSLPAGGIDGLHPRDGSFLRKKQEQWARERAEGIDVNGWFPRRSPGGGNPNRPRSNTTNARSDAPASVETRNHHCNNENNGTQSGQHLHHVASSSSSNRNPTVEISQSSSPIVLSHSPYPSAIPLQSPMPILHPTQYLPPVRAPPGGCYPPAMTSANGVQFVYASTAYGQPIPVEYLQAGQPRYPMGYALPVYPAGSATTGEMHFTSSATTSPTSCVLPSHETCMQQTNVMQASYTEQWANQLPFWDANETIAIHNHSKREEANDMRSSSLPPITANASSLIAHVAPGQLNMAVVHPLVMPQQTASNTGGSGMKEMQQSQMSPGINEYHTNAMTDSMSSIASSHRRRTTSGDHDEKQMKMQIAKQTYDEQVAEKRRLEALRAEHDRRETIEAERERRRIETILQTESNAEHNRWRHQSEEASRREMQMQEAVEKAKREADVLRKARLFKHVLEAPDSNAELTNKLLGIDENTAGINVNRVNEQVIAFERQKRLDFETLNNSMRQHRDSAEHDENQSKNDSRKHAKTGVRSSTGGGGDRPIHPSHSCEDNTGTRDLLLAASPSSHRVSPSSSSSSPFTRRGPGRTSMRTPSSPRHVVDTPRRADSLERLDGAREERDDKRQSSFTDTVASHASASSPSQPPTTAPRRKARQNVLYDMNGVTDGNGGDAYRDFAPLLGNAKAGEGGARRQATANSLNSSRNRDDSTISGEHEMNRAREKMPNANRENGGGHRRESHANERNDHGRVTTVSPGEIAPVTRRETPRRASDVGQLIAEIPNADEDASHGNFQRRPARFSPGAAKRGNGKDMEAMPNALYEVIATRTRRMRGTEIGNNASFSSSNSPAPTSSNDSMTSPLSSHAQCELKDAINGDRARSSTVDSRTEESVQSPTSSNGEKDEVYGRSRVAYSKTRISLSPQNGSLSSPPPTHGLTAVSRPSPFARRLPPSPLDDPLSLESRRATDLTPGRWRTSTASLFNGSTDDVAMNGGHNEQHNIGERVASPSLERFNHKASQYRSFNLKKGSDRQQRVLDQLAQLREQLRSKQAAVGGGNGVSPLSRSATTGSMLALAAANARIGRIANNEGGGKNGRQ